MTTASVIVFGYGELVLAALDTLLEMESNVVAVVTPSNRTGPDVQLARDYAAARGLLVLEQPPRKQIGNFVKELQFLAPDVILVWSYSMILPPAVINIPRLGCVNMHGGLLPEYRGGHVLQWAIINGEPETGVTLHFMDEKIDAGAVIAESRFRIEAEDDAATIRTRLKAAGQNLLQNYWRQILNGTAPILPQDESRARYHRLRTADDGLISWSQTAVQIHNLVRALVTPWPGAFTFWQGKKLIVYGAVAIKAPPLRRQMPGTVSEINESGLSVFCGQGELLIVSAEIDGQLLGPRELQQIGIAHGEILGGELSAQTI
jgi:methionyl-tRNA formyltransferase